jgi:hypothetical protein
MAASHIVPWTNPGGVPCCCEDEPVVFCPLLGTGNGNQFINAYRISITSSEYAAFYAGGIMAVSFTGSASATAVSLFNDAQGKPLWTCQAAGTVQTTINVSSPANRCTTSNSPISNNQATVAYNHYLEGDPATDTYSIFFDIIASGGVEQSCGIGRQASASSWARTYIGDVPPIVNAGGGLGQQTGISIPVSFGNGNGATIPAYSEQFTGVLFFSKYTSISGTSSASAVWSSSAP